MSTDNRNEVHNPPNNHEKQDIWVLSIYRFILFVIFSVCCLQAFVGKVCVILLRTGEKKSE